VKSGNQGSFLGSGLRLPVAQPSSYTTAVQCPQCGSSKIWKDGMRYEPYGEIQRYLCRDCSYRFSYSQGSEPSERLQKVHRQILSCGATLPSTRQVCVSQTKAMINLATVETRTQEKAAGATTPDLATIKGKLVEFALWLSKQGYTEDVAKWRSTVMKRLVDLGANLWNPETVKEILVKQKTWSNSYKMVLCYAYENFLTMEGLSWSRPKYKQDEAFPFIPTEAELNQLIAACGKKIGTFLQGLKDTGADPGELAAIRWTDVNLETRAIQLRPVKGHRPRVITVSQQFIDRFQQLPKTSERIFKVHNLIGAFVRQRRRLAQKFANPRLLKISFRTFRHWKGTMEYHRTKDILYVQKLLGHKHIQNTLKYIDLEANIFQSTDDQFFVKVASSVQEACSLIETGFEYVTGEYLDGGKIFRKRK
jgi:integrase